MSECHGQVELTYTKCQHRTELTHQYSCSPLLVQKPFYPDPPVCQTVILHTAGGMVGGDRLSQKVTLYPAAQAIVTTATAAKIYRTAGLPCSQGTQITLAPQAQLTWLPQETIIFNQAIYQQHTQIEIAATASLIFWEITRLGRSARGEKFQQGQWRSATEVFQAGQPVWIDRQQVISPSEILTSPHGLANQPVIGTLCYLGQSLSPEHLQYLAQAKPADAIAGMTDLPIGLLCRYRGNSTSQAKQWFSQVWQGINQIRQTPTQSIPRVWQLIDNQPTIP